MQPITNLSEGTGYAGAYPAHLLNSETPEGCSIKSVPNENPFYGTPLIFQVEVLMRDSNRFPFRLEVLNENYN